MDWSYLFFSFDGRIGRKAFWIAFGLIVAGELAAHSLAGRIEGQRLSAIVSLAFTYPEFALFAKRGHDRNISTHVTGLFFFLSVLMDFLIVTGLSGEMAKPSLLFSAVSIPWMIFAVVLLVELGVRQGTNGPNRFGPDPLSVPADPQR